MIAAIAVIRIDARILPFTTNAPLDTNGVCACTYGGLQNDGISLFTVFVHGLRIVTELSNDSRACTTAEERHIVVRDDVEDTPDLRTTGGVNRGGETDEDLNLRWLVNAETKTERTRRLLADGEEVRDVNPRLELDLSKEAVLTS